MAGISVHEAEIMMHDNYAAFRKEYTRLRDIAQKRIKRLGESDFSETQAYMGHTYETMKTREIVDTETGEIVKERYKAKLHGFQELKNIAKEDLAKAFSELSKFVGAKASTVSGQKSIKAKTIETWNKQGLGLNNQNYNKAIKILQEMRKRKMTYGSDKVVSLADSMLSLDDQQTNQWLDHLDDLLPHADELQEIPNLQGYDFDEILEMIGE